MNDNQSHDFDVAFQPAPGSPPPDDDTRSWRQAVTQGAEYAMRSMGAEPVYFESSKRCRLDLVWGPWEIHIDPDDWNGNVLSGFHIFAEPKLTGGTWTEND